tara:strand:+ start:262 stop:4212 length:3951 start_codon:yes stop_codon:yes gene_type:complete
MSEALPPTGATVAYGDFARYVREIGLSPTVKQLVTSISGNDKIYDDLAKTGLNDFEIANDFFELEKLDPTFIQTEGRQGLDLRESARLLADDLGLNYGQLQEEQGFDTADFLGFFTKGRRPSVGEAITETVGRAAVTGGGMAAGAGTGATLGMLTGPFATFAVPIFTVTGAIVGGVGAEKAKEQIFPQEPIIEPGMRPLMVGGETLLETIFATPLLRGGKVLQDFAYDKIGDEFKNRGFFADRLRETAAGRSFNIVKSEAFRQSDKINAIDPNRLQRYIEKTAKEDPVLFAYLRSYQRNPKSTIAAEILTGLGAASGATVAEIVAPGDQGVRGAFEIGAAAPLSYISLFPYFRVAKDYATEKLEKFRGTMAEEEQERRVGVTLLDFIENLGDDPQEFIDAVNTGAFQRAVADTLEAHDRNYGDLSQDQIADLPTTTRMLASLSSNDLKSNVSLDILEDAIKKKIPEANRELKVAYTQQTQRLRELLAALTAAGDNADALSVAGLAREKLFRETVNARLDQAINDQRRIVDQFGDATMNPAARREAGKKLDAVMDAAFKDIRKQQNALYEAIPANIFMGQKNLLKAIKTLDEQLPPEARGEILPSVALATEKKFADIARKQKLTNEIQELEEDLVLLRSERPIFDQRLSKAQQDALTEKYGQSSFSNSQIQKEVKERLAAANKASDELGSVDDTPITRRQLSGYRTIMLDKAREAGAAGKRNEAIIYSTLAKGIEDDFADLDTIEQLNDIGAVDMAQLNSKLSAASAFTRAFKDTFERSFPNKLQRERRTGELVINPELLYKEIVRGSGDEQDIIFEQIGDAVTFLQRSLVDPGTGRLDPAAEESLIKATEERSATISDAYESIFRTLARSKIVKVTGDEPEIDLPALRRFLDQNATMLDRIPNLRRDLENAETARVALIKAREDLQKGEAEFFASRLFKEVTGLRPDQAIDTTLGVRETDPRKAFFDLLDNLRVTGLRLDANITEDQIEDRLKRSILSWARGKSIGLRPGEGFGETADAMFEAAADTPDFRKMYTALFSGQSGSPSLMSILSRGGPKGQKPLFSSLERSNLEKILKRGIELQRPILDTTGEVVEEVTPDIDLLTGLLIKLSGSKIGSALARFIPGRGQGLIEAGAGVRFLEKALAPVPTGAVDDILLKAVRDPEFMRYILDKGVVARAAGEGAKDLPGVSRKQQAKEIKRLKAYLLPILGSGIQEVLSETEEEILQGQLRPFEEEAQRSQRVVPPDAVPPPYIPAMEGVQPVAPPIAPPVSAAMSVPAPTAPNTQLRQRFAALYPDDPISPLIEAQGIGTLPQGRV